MDLDEIKRSLEPASGGAAQTTAGLPARFFDAFILQGITIDRISHGHIICSMIIPPRFVNSGGLLCGGLMATLVDLVGSAVFYSAGLSFSGVSVEISMSFVDSARVEEEIEFDAKILKAGKTIGVSTVEIRKKKTGKIVAQGRHAKYIAIASKL